MSPVYEPALNLAQAIVRRYNSKLFVTRVISPAESVWVPPEYWVSKQQVEDVIQGQMQELNGNLQGVPHEVLLEYGGVPEAVSEEINKLGIDLLVVGTHGRDGFGRLMMGSIAEEIFRRVSCPVLTVGPGVTARKPDEAEFEEILFATNFGPGSFAAAPYAISLAQEFQARLTILNVVIERIDSRIEPRTIVRDRLDRLRSLIPPDADLWCNPECVVEFGSAAEQILKLAHARSVDLIVLGAKAAEGHTVAATHFASATTHAVVGHAGCPVMTVRAPAKPQA